MMDEQLSAEHLSEAAYANAAFQTLVLGMLMECRVEDGLTTKANAAATLRRYAGYCDLAATAMPFLPVAEYLEHGSGLHLTLIDGGLSKQRNEDGTPQG